MVVRNLSRSARLAYMFNGLGQWKVLSIKFIIMMRSV